MKTHLRIQGLLVARCGRWLDELGDRVSDFEINVTCERCVPLGEQSLLRMRYPLEVEALALIKKARSLAPWLSVEVDERTQISRTTAVSVLLPAEEQAKWIKPERPAEIKVRRVREDAIVGEPCARGGE